MTSYDFYKGQLSGPQADHLDHVVSQYIKEKTIASGMCASGCQPVWDNPGGFVSRVWYRHSAWLMVAVASTPPGIPGIIWVTMVRQSGSALSPDFLALTAWIMRMWAHTRIYWHL